MEFFPINIKEQKFKVSVADTEASRYKGLSGVSKLGRHKGLLFIFPKPEEATMVMRDMNFDLDFLFLDKDWEIIQLGSLENKEGNSIKAIQPTSMILELPKGTIKRLGLGLNMRLSPGQDISTHYKGVEKFKSGGKFELIGDKVYKIKIDDIKAEKGRLQILNDGGEVVANIDSGARIFSREHTKELIKKLKDGDTLALADSMINILEIQDGQAPDYVKN